jgi:hypothetical protein
LVFRDATKHRHKPATSWSGLLISALEAAVGELQEAACTHVRMVAKRRALDEIAARQIAADKKRKADAERQQAAAVTSKSAVIQ